MVVLLKLTVVPLIILVKPLAGTVSTVICCVAILGPAMLLAVNEAVNVPGVLYVTVTLLAVEVAGLPPGNDHCTVVAFVEVLLNSTVSGSHPVVGVAVNAATGGVASTTVLLLVEVPQILVVVNVTLYVPPVVKVWVGFWSVLVVPSPKFHKKPVPLGEIPAKLTVLPFIVKVKFDIGADIAVIKL